MGIDEQQSPIQVRDLHKSFGSQKVLDGIGLAVRKGETLAVLGRSGTGKSVLLKLLIGLQVADSGSVRINGAEIAGLGDTAMNEIRKKMGFLFQQSALYDSMLVEENVAFPLARHTQLSEQERKERARTLLADVGMDKDLGKFPSELSGGMQKRVALARALALDPEILLFDEPTSGLDPITAAEIGSLIAGLKDKRSVTSVVVTHDMPGSRPFVDRFVLLHEGVIAAQGTFAELQASRDSFVREFLQKPGGE
jgi:phospholipid/cholesterol/gamma-HCH transport system ATP-binding protein